MQPTELSHTEENYLKVVYHLLEKHEAASTNSIAEKLNTKPASVSDMLKKLDSKGLINYIKYKGVTLTAEGKSIALWIIRKHRLWEVFLVEKMKFNWDEVHEVAEQLEHIKSRRLIEQLDWFLEYPQYDPHGDPIPDNEGKVRQLPTQPLSEAAMNTDLKVVTVSDSSSAFLQYLDKVGITIGISIKIIDKIAYDGSLELEIDGKPHLISNQGAQNILVVA